MSTSSSFHENVWKYFYTHMPVLANQLITLWRTCIAKYGTFFVVGSVDVCWYMSLMESCEPWSTKVDLYTTEPTIQTSPSSKAVATRATEQVNTGQCRREWGERQKKNGDRRRSRRQEQSQSRGQRKKWREKQKQKRENDNNNNNNNQNNNNNNNNNNDDNRNHNHNNSMEAGNPPRSRGLSSQPGKHPTGQRRTREPNREARQQAGSRQSTEEPRIVEPARQAPNWTATHQGT